jgi:hypothetical protein
MLKAHYGDQRIMPSNATLAKGGVAVRNGLAPHGKNRARFRSGRSLPAASRLLGMWLGIRNNSRER